MTGIKPDEPNVQLAQHDPDWPAPDPAPAPKPRRARPWRPLSVLLLFGAAILTLFGSFLELSTVQLSPGLKLRFTSWTVTLADSGPVDGPLPAGISANLGLPLAFAATALLAAAVAVLLAAAAPGSVAITRTGSMLAIGATAFLAGTSWALTMEQLSVLERFRPRSFGDRPVPFDYDGSLQIGFWLQVAANAVAIAGVVLALLPLGKRTRQRVEPETPRFGVPVAVVHRLPDAPPDEAN